MDGLTLGPGYEPASIEFGESANRISPEQRAAWVIDYITLHQGEDRSHLLRRVVQQIAAAEAQAYERGWGDAISSKRGHEGVDPASTCRF